MTLSRRNLLKSGAILSTTGLLPSSAQAQAQQELPKPLQSLRPLGDRVQPITTDEFQARVIKAQKLMTDSKPQLSALYLTPGTSLYYFSGIRWSVSERLLALVIPRAGDPLMVGPAFEEGRLREQLRWPIEVRVWQEDENPSAVVAKWLAERRMRTGRIAIEETTRYTFFDHLREAAPTLEYVSADPITIGCRATKSARELELMRLACEATCAAFRAVFASLQEGMTQRDVQSLIEAANAQLGFPGGALVLIGEWAALPHGTLKPQIVRENQVVLIDGGNAVEGYQSDVTRCGVIGKPSEKLLGAFEILRRAQDAVLDACRSGKLCGAVDDAARAVVTSAGFGPDYKFFTHRLGHGIGLDGHEHPYLVRGSTTVLQPGMTFSNEPGIYVRGDYGVRLEDDMVVMPDGAAQLLTPGFSPSLEKPFG